MKLIPRRYFLLMAAMFAVLELAAVALSWGMAFSWVRAGVEADTFLAGSVLLSPDDALEWTPISGRSAEQWAAGAPLLARYGYDAGMSPLRHPDFAPLFGRTCMLVCGAIAVAFVLFFGCMAALLRRVNKRVDRMASCVAVDGEPEVRYGVGSLDRLALALHEQYARRMSSGERAINDRRYMKELLADMSHQLKTPLASMRMYVELMQRMPDMDADTRARFLSESMGQLERTEWLVQGLLKMARLEAGAVKLNLRDTSIDDTLELAVAPFRISAQMAHTELTVEGCGASFPHDADWLAEATGNLIKNALENAPGGHVCVRAVATPLTVELSVSDDGTGIAPDVLPHLFERFYSRPSSTRTGSVGLGLALAREIVTLSGGTISVDSELGRGTTFNIVFLLNH